MEIFVAVASHGSFTIAAKELNTSRTALGAMVDALEGTIGERLFNRKRSVGLKLTAAGERLLPRALSLLRDAESIGYGLGAGEDLDGELVIGATVSLASTVVPRLLIALAAGHPRLKVRVVMRSAEELIDLMEVGGIELLFSYAQPTPLRQLGCETLFETRFGLITAKSAPISAGSSFEIRSLGSRPVAILDNAISRQKLFDYLEQTGSTDAYIRYRVGTLPLCLEIVRHRLAWGIVPVFSLMKQDLPDDLECHVLSPAPPILPATVSWQPNVSLSLAAKVAIETTRALRVEQQW
jgi:DNA-binding transcriptional LysR family regulator